MTYQISFKKVDDYLYVTVKGEANFENILGVWKDIVAECDRSECMNVLLDGTLAGQASMLEIYNVGEQFRHVRKPPKLKVAIVCKVQDLGRLSFHETVIANRIPGVTIRNFSNREDAESWLTDEQLG